MNFHWPINQAPQTQSWFKTWDGQNYLYISQWGYTPEYHFLYAFYPLWPFLIRVFSMAFTGHYLISSLVLSNFLSLSGLAMLHGILAKKDTGLADRTILLLIAFPGSLFFMFPYTESLFLFLSVLFFWLLHERRYVAASIASFALPLTRVVGIFSVIPLAYQWALDTRHGKQTRIWQLLLLLAAPLGLLSYFGIMYAFTGDALSGIQAQQYCVASRSIAKLADLNYFIKEYLSVDAFLGFTHSWMDRFWFTVYALSLPAMWRQNKLFFSYALFIGLFPVMTGSFMSFTRFASVIFPMFAAWAAFFDEKKPRWIFLILVIVLFSMQVYFLMLHATNRWVG